MRSLMLTAALLLVACGDKEEDTATEEVVDDTQVAEETGEAEEGDTGEETEETEEESEETEEGGGEE